MKQYSVWLFAVGILSFGGTLRAAEASKEGVEFFEKNIRPVLADNCYKCHSTEATKVKGNFYADSLAGLTKKRDGGTQGVIAGDPDKSLLIKSIRYAYAGDDESLNMPPKSKKDGTGGKLADNVIKNFEQWVKMGAPVPKDFEESKNKKAEAGGGAHAAQVDPKNHWAFQQPKLSVPPAVKDAGWTKNDVDKFILAKLEAKNLHPQPIADRRTLIRRATFDLLGLPPTPEEVEAFTADSSPDAYAKLIDRLLADPRYGERWARHWLDVARYSDTKGYVFQEERRYPYAYTYRDYVIKSFNGDKPYDQFLIEQIAADQLDLKEDKSPLAAMGFLTLGRRFLNNANDIIDDRIDVVCRGTMALTVGCARCHDHKFDPIPTKDYYSLHGVFASSMEPKDLPLIADDKDPSPGAVAYRAELAKRQAALDEYRTSRSNEILAGMRTAKGLSDYLMGVSQMSAGKDVGGEATADMSRYMLARWKTYLVQQGMKKDAVFAAWRLYAALPAGEFEAKAAGVTEKLAQPDSKAIKVAVNPIIASAFAEKSPKSLKEVAERYGEVLAKFDKADKLDNADEEAIRLSLRGSDAPLVVPPTELTRLFKRDSQDKFRGLQNKVDEFQATSPDAPARAMVMTDAPNPHNSPVLMRGNPGNPGPVVQRQFLECVSGPDRKPFSKGSGRLEFAQSIASKQNPLTARVLVNRVWGWHFGKPIVRTPSDFGTRSDTPTHPELLDYLAVSFMNDGWSIKALQKRIMLSATYMQTSDDNPAARAVDSENTLLWRQNRTRLDFEQTRDSLLAVSGQLDKAMFGKPIDAAVPEASRRTIYSFIDRQNLPSMFRSFDFASPDMHAPIRFQTTVPQQALFFMNSPFSQRQAKLVLERADVKGQTDVAAKATRLYQLLYGRKPSAEELTLARTFIDAETGTPTETPVEQKPVWSYGYGKVDAEGKKVTFTALPYRGREGFRGSKKLPDPVLGFVSLTANGGHPGDKDHAAIRRWTAPVAGTLTIASVLTHPVDNGDGVTGKIVSSRAGVLGTWHVKNSKTDAAVKNQKVEAGESIDFIIECGPTVTSDGFTWSPNLRLESDKLPGGAQQFDAARDFASSSNEPAAPVVKLSAWEKYAQVLMMSDEFVFVD